MNAKIELLSEIRQAGKSVEDIVLAHVKVTGYDCEVEADIKNGVNEFFNALDVEYDNGYGVQTIFGNIVFNDSSWLSIYEYDGKSMWVMNKCPTEENYTEHFTHIL